MKFNILILLLVFSLFSCSDPEYSDLAFADSEVPPDGKSKGLGKSQEYHQEVRLGDGESKTELYAYASKERTDSQNEEKSESKRKLIKRANIKFQSDSLGKTRNSINKIIKKSNAYYSDEEEYESMYQEGVRLVVRVPSKNFDMFIAELSKSVNKFETFRIYKDDVTEAYTDLNARIKNKKELEQRYLSILKKAHKVKDIIEIENEISKLRTDIEVMEGRLRLMKDQISFSIININFYHKLEYQAEEEKEHGFVDAFVDGWEKLVLFLIGMVNAWPLVLFLIFIVVISFRIRKKITKKK